MAETEEVMIATRVSKPLHKLIVKRQCEMYRLTGITPSISAVIRAILEQSLKPKRKSAPSERAA